MAIGGRNEFSHGNLPSVFREWHSILLTWIEVALMIEADYLATEFLILSVSDQRGAVHRLAVTLYNIPVTRL